MTVLLPPHRSPGLVDLGWPRGVVAAGLFRRCATCSRPITGDTPVRGRYCELQCWEYELRRRYERLFGEHPTFGRILDFTVRSMQRPLAAARREHGLPEFQHYPDERYADATFSKGNDCYRALGPEYAQQDDIERMHEIAEAEEDPFA